MTYVANNADKFGVTPIASELLRFFLAQDYEKHHIDNIEYTENGYRLLTFNEGSIINQNLKKNDVLNINLIRRAIEETSGSSVKMPTWIDSDSFYTYGIDMGLGIGRGASIVTYYIDGDEVEASITITDNWDHSKDIAYGSFYRDAYILQQSEVRKTFAYKTTYHVKYPYDMINYYSSVD